MKILKLPSAQNGLLSVAKFLITIMPDYLPAPK